MKNLDVLNDVLGFLPDDTIKNIAWLSEKLPSVGTRQKRDYQSDCPVRPTTIDRLGQCTWRNAGASSLNPVFWNVETDQYASFPLGYWGINVPHNEFVESGGGGLIKDGFSDYDAECTRRYLAYQS